MSSTPDVANQTLIGWRGIEFFAPGTLRLAAERIGPHSSYSIFSDKGYPRVELIIDKSKNYDSIGLLQWVERLIKSRQAEKWEDVKKYEAEVFGHRALRITGHVEGGRFIAYAWVCAGMLKFFKLNLQRESEDWLDIFRSLKCHRSDGMMLLSLYEFQILAPSTLWISAINSTTGAFSLVLEDENNVVVVERAGPAAALGMDMTQWLRRFHSKILDKYKVFIGREPCSARGEGGHQTITYPIHPKGLAVRRKTLGLVEAWLCNVNDRFWALSAISYAKKTAPTQLPNIKINCHSKAL
ncbi:hypothetical protein HRbin02_01635 [Candidatus Calditenuaceae archaeon HR02]|nr:hypothetical protein HRbin02_01635 [Candidatus Calditenuaceae archaeon HR02]